MKKSLKISKSGYKKDSPDKNEDSLIIPSNNITMKNVNFPVMGVDDLGNHILMQPGQDYNFPGNYVHETPIKNKSIDNYPVFMQQGGFMMGDNSGFDYPLFMQTGGFIPPNDAQKVSDVPNDFQFSGKAGNKQYFVKNVQAPGAVTGTMTTDSNSHNQFLIKQLQAGVKPEDLVTAGHATTAGIQPLLGYYKPSAVFIEPVANTPVTPQKQPIPLNESDRVEMKQIFPPSGNKYLTYQVPDPNAGYNKSTEKYYDPKTFRPIDPLKSFDNSGNYSPSFLYTDPNQETLGEKYRGTKIATRYDTAKIGQADTLNVNPAIMNGTAGYKMGGATHDYCQFGGPLDKFIKGNKNEAPQGLSMDAFIDQKNNGFIDYLAKNTRDVLFRDSATDFNNLRAQLGAQIPIAQTDPQLMPDPHFDQNNAYLQFLNNQQMNMTPGSNTNQPVSNSNSNIADYAMAGVQTLNKFFNSYNSNQQNLFNQKKMTIENTVPAQYGSKGNYDINQGNFRPNQKTPSYYKKGGSYSIDHKSLKQLIAEGYEFEII